MNLKRLGVFVLALLSAASLRADVAPQLREPIQLASLWSSSAPIGAANSAPGRGPRHRHRSQQHVAGLRNAGRCERRLRPGD